MIKLSNLIEAQDIEKEQLEEGAFAKLLGGLSIFLGSLAIGGVKVSQMDNDNRQAIEQASKTQFGNKLDSMSSNEVDMLYKEMEKNVDKKHDFKITLDKKAVSKANHSKLAQASTVAKKMAILQCMGDNEDAFGLKGDKVVISNDSTNVKGTDSVAAKPSAPNTLSGSISSWIRKKFPNVAQLYLTRDLSTEDFSNAQKKILADCIKAAIKRTGKVDRGGTEYADYGGDVAKIYSNSAGPSTLTTIMKTASSDNAFGMATTIGRFSYVMNKDSSYTITDTYDFSGTSSYTVKPDELKDMSYVEKVAYIMKKDKVTTYQAIRHLGYLENPDTKSGAKKIKIIIPAQMMNGKQHQKGDKTIATDDKDASKLNGKEKQKKIDNTGASPEPEDGEKEKPKQGVPEHKTHTIKPVITLCNGKPHYKMKNGKPVIKLREMLKELVAELASEA